MALPRFLTASDAARVLGVTPGAVRLMLKRGTLPSAEQTAGGISLFLRDDVNRLAAERRDRQAADERSRSDPAPLRRSRGGR